MLASWDSFVDPESIARLIDAFVDSLDMEQYAVKQAAVEGRPSYDPAGLYKLYIYGNQKGLRSSRRLAESCRLNIEVKWLMGGVEPNFRTISDFRKQNIDNMKKIFHEFNERLSGAVEWGFTSIDGSKFLACNSKNNNFTKNKLDDRIQWLGAHIEEYLRILDEEDAKEMVGDEPDCVTIEVIQAKMEEARARLAKYEEYQKLMEENGLTQLSLTDADARLMKGQNGHVVAYNPQTAVDSETHLIRDFSMTNQVTDHGLILPTMKDIRSESTGEILEVVADKGYEKTEDIIACLENGIIPHVIMQDGKDGYMLELNYEEAEADPTSTDPEEIKKCLHAGQIPDAYQDVVTEISVKEVRRKEEDPSDAEKKIVSVYGTKEEMLERAREGYFVRDPEANLVYCPAGNILRQKSIKNNGNIRYSNKHACKHCPHRNMCYRGANQWKEVDFSKDCLEKKCKTWVVEDEAPNPTDAEMRSEQPTESQPKKTIKYVKKKIVTLFFKPNREKTAHRMCLSEHPFGTIKRSMGASYFLLRGMRKVAGEFALFCLGYNIRRAQNLLGFDKLMELMAAK